MSNTPGPPHASDYVLCIDAGSTWCKAAYIERSGRVVAQGAAWVRDERPFGHDAMALMEIWEGVREAVAEANRELGGSPQPAALAVAARKAQGIWLDGAGEPIGLPAGAVNDAGRTEIDACYASPVWGEDDPFAYGYGLDLIGNTRWLWRNRPEDWARVRRAGNLHSWLIYRLTGRWACSHASGPVRDVWPETVRVLTGLPASVYPVVARDTQILRHLLPGAGLELGLPADTPVVTGSHDGAAANIGAGAIQPGDACLTFGTNGVLRVVAGTRLPRRFGYIVTVDRWALVRDLPGLALLLDGVVTAIDGPTAQATPERHRELSELAEDLPIGSNGLHLKLFPESVGMTAAQALGRGHEPAAVYRAALEAAASGFAGLVQQARLAGATPARYFATGGAADNDLLIRTTSACLGAPITLNDAEAGLLGLAMLAAVASGWTTNVDTATSAMLANTRTIDAAPAERAAYATLVNSSQLTTGVAPGDAVAGPSI